MYYEFEVFWPPEWLAVTLALGAVYLLLAGPFRRYFRGSEPVPFSKKLMFLSGLFVNYIALGSPLELFSSYLFSVHSLQMSLYYFVMPPLLLSGIPPWLLRPVIGIAFVKKSVSWLTQPIFALLLFNVVLSLYHIPVVFDFLAVNLFYDGFVHTLILLLAFMMWWNITCPLPEMDRLPEVPKAAYIFSNLLLLSPACMAIMALSSPVYQSFLNVPRLWDGLTPLLDQKLGGLAMELLQAFALGTAIWQIIAKHRLKQQMVFKRNVR